MLRAIALAACLGSAAALSMEQSLYPGRFGDIVFTSEPTSDESCHLVMVGVGKAAGPSSMPETSLAPLAAHIVGALPTAFPGAMPEVATRVAAAASALLTIVVEGVTLADVAALPHLSQIVSEGHAVRLEPAFAPRDRVSAAVSRMTGTTPADHGIASKAWIDGKTGELVAAFSAGRDESAARVAAVSDVVAQSSAGRALILSLSSDTQLAAAAGTHPSLARDAGASWPAAVVSYDADTRSLKPAQLGSSLAESIFAVSHEQALAALRAVVPAELAQLDTAQAEVAALVAELGGFLVILQRLSADTAVAPLLADRQADLVTLSLAALAPLKANAQAVQLVDAALPQLLAAFSRVWGDKARAQIVLTPADADVAVAAVEGWTVVGAHAFAHAASEVSKLAGCDKFAVALEGSMTTAHCLVKNNRRRLYEEAGAVTYTSDQLELFQVTLWASILLVVVLLAATCTLYNMEVTQDSLLFSKGKND